MGLASTYIAFSRDAWLAYNRQLRCPDPIAFPRSTGFPPLFAVVKLSWARPAFCKGFCLLRRASKALTLVVRQAPFLTALFFPSPRGHNTFAFFFLERSSLGFADICCIPDLSLSIAISRMFPVGFFS